MELADARALVKDKTDKDITVRHLISVEGVMRALARRFGEDEDRWALAGLFHDLDQDQTGEDPSRHGYLAAGWLREAGVEEPVVNAVLAHAHERSGGGHDGGDVLLGPGEGSPYADWVVGSQSNPGRCPRLAKALASAFQDDPVITWVP